MERYQESIERFKIPIALCLVGFVLLIGGIIVSSKDPKQFPQDSLIKPLDNKLKVDIAGAVVNPGVYELTEGARVQDVINAAGGIKEDANKEYLDKNINLALKISDGIKIYIPYKNEQSSFSNEIGLNISQNNNSQIIGTSSSSQINLNTASQSQLESLSGIGPATAAKIINGRPYQKIEDLLTKKIIGKSLFEKIKTFLTVI